MSTEKITADDPRLTAYALGELEGDDLTLVEQALAHDPELAAEFDAIKALSGELESELTSAANEP